MHHDTNLGDKDSIFWAHKNRCSYDVIYIESISLDINQCRIVNGRDVSLSTKDNNSMIIILKINVFTKNSPEIYIAKTKYICVIYDGVKNGWKLNSK